MEKQRQAAVLVWNPKAVVSVTDPGASVCTALCLSLENGRGGGLPMNGL